MALRHSCHVPLSHPVHLGYVRCHPRGVCDLPARRSPLLEQKSAPLRFRRIVFKTATCYSQLLKLAEMQVSTLTLTFDLFFKYRAMGKSKVGSFSTCPCLLRQLQLCFVTCPAAKALFAVPGRRWKFFFDL